MSPSPGSDAGSLLLYGVFQALRKAGVSLTIRDYLDGLQALDLMQPFAGPEAEPLIPQRPKPRDGPDRRRVRERGRLVWLAQTLWARTALERQIVDRCLSAQVGPPPALEVRRLRRLLGAGLPDEAEPEPRAPALSDDEPTEAEGLKKSTRQDGGAGKGGAAKSGHEPDGLPFSLEPSAGVGDMSLPTLRAEPRQRLAGRFLLEPPPIISLRHLVTVWRRFFVPSRRSPSRQLDVAATVEQISRSGLLLEPVLSSRRTNMASLLVLFDVASAMAPWRSFEMTLRESLDPKLSRLKKASLFYFSGMPGETVFRRRELYDGEPLEDLLTEHRGQPLLVIGEADASRGVFDARKQQKMTVFLERARMAEIRPLLWINPMQPARWRGTTTECLLEAPHVHVLALGKESLLHAVDILRGARAR